jgi:uncharacterized metal-binding protein YceD (DUF177 family)
MEEVFSIYIDRLKGGQEEIIEETIPPDFMEIQESELAFHKPIQLKGTASLSMDTLILHLSVKTEATMPCSICNKEIPVKILLPNLYITEDIENFRGGIFNFKEALREQILLELPPVAECNNGSCGERENVAKFLKKNKDESNTDTYHPFRDL